jgi:primosomal protein N''
MFRKVLSQIEKYRTLLSKADFDTNEQKIKAEIDKIVREFTPDRQIAVEVNFNNQPMKLDKFVTMLKQQHSDLLEKKDVRKMYDTNLFHNIDGENVDVSTEDARESLKRDIAALERQIQEREQTLAEIDNYVVTLLTGETAQLNIAHTNAKFVKVADQPTQEEVLEPVEEYFDNLYNDTPGSPNMGKLYTHPEKHRNELSTEAQVGNSKQKFKKK